MRSYDVDEEEDDDDDDEYNTYECNFSINIFASFFYYLYANFQYFSSLDIICLLLIM